MNEPKTKLPPPTVLRMTKGQLTEALRIRTQQCQDAEAIVALQGKALIAMEKQVKRADKLAAKLKRATGHVRSFKDVARRVENKLRQELAKSAQLERQLEKMTHTMKCLRDAEQSVETRVSTGVAPWETFRLEDWATFKAEIERRNAEVAMRDKALERARLIEEGLNGKVLEECEKRARIETDLNKMIGDLCIERDSATMRLNALEWMDSALGTNDPKVVISRSEYQAMAESHDRIESGEVVILTNSAYTDMMTDLDRLGPLEERKTELELALDLANSEYNDLKVRLDDAETNVKAARFGADQHAAAADKYRSQRNHKQMLLEESQNKVHNLTAEIRTTVDGISELRRRHAEQLDRLANHFAEIAINQAKALCGGAGR